MFNFIKGLFSRGGVVEKGMEMIDKGKFSNQEKAQMQKQLFEISTNLSARTRRWIAWLVTASFLTCFVTSFFTAYWNEALSEHLLHVLKDSLLGESFMLVGSMYFGGRILSKLTNKK